MRRFTTSDITSVVALAIVVATGTAFASHPGGANTITTGDIVDGEVRSPDLANGGIQPVDIAPNSIPSTRLADGGVQGIDIADDTVRAADIAPNAIGSGRVANDSLTGLDIDESTLEGVDAATLGGKDSSEIVHGNGQVATNRFVAPPLGGGAANVFLSMPTMGNAVWVRCGNGPTPTVEFLYVNHGPGTITAYMDDGGTDPIRWDLPPGQGTGPPAATGHERIIFQGSRDEGAAHDVATVIVTASAEAGGCPVQGTAVIHPGAESVSSSSERAAANDGSVRTPHGRVRGRLRRDF